MYLYDWLGPLYLLIILYSLTVISATMIKLRCELSIGIFVTLHYIDDDFHRCFDHSSMNCYPKDYCYEPLLSCYPDPFNVSIDWIRNFITLSLFKNIGNIFCLSSCAKRNTEFVLQNRKQMDLILSQKPSIRANLKLTSPFI